MSHMSAGGLLIPGDIIRAVVASSSLTLSIICTMYYYRNLEFPNHIAIIKSTVLLHQSYVTCIKKISHLVSTTPPGTVVPTKWLKQDNQHQLMPHMSEEGEP
jgi:hypothetical protein